MSYALLGNVAFDLLHAPKEMSERQSATFAEHAVIMGKPQLQAMNLALAERTLALQLHHQLGNVESRWQTLMTAFESQEPLALVFGISDFQGHFAITDIESQTLFTDEKGQALARDVSLTLKEYVGEISSGILGQALAINGNSPLAAFLPKGIASGINKAVNAVRKGIETYRQAKRVVSEVKNTVAVMKSLKNNPLQALSYLPTALNQLGIALTPFAQLAGMSRELATSSQKAQLFLQDVAKIGEPLNEAYTLFNQGLKAKNLNGSWFENGIAALNDAEAVAEKFAKNAAEMTAWIAIRQDETEENTGENNE